MSRAAALGNGHMLVLFDHNGQLRDFHYPYIGSENHTGEHVVHRIGVYTHGNMKWFDDPSWNVTLNCAGETMATNIAARNDILNTDINIEDVIYNEQSVLLRKFTVQNTNSEKREIKVYFGHEFHIYESYRGDTAYYDPRYLCMIHYKGRRVFLMNAMTDQGVHFDQYTTGIFGAMGKDGSYKDAEDGFLSQNPIQHGKVDSVIGVTLEIDPKQSKVFHYWMIAGHSIEETVHLNTEVISKTPDHIIQTTKDYWHAWVHKQDTRFCNVDYDAKKLFSQSLLNVSAHMDSNGSIIASADSDMLRHGFDTYSYMWPRDGALIVIAMIKAGYTSNLYRFFEYCDAVLTEDGYMMHKYKPDGSLGSSWHPWVREGRISLPIQEDETALVVLALKEYYDYTKDLELVERFYNTLVFKTSSFMVQYVNGQYDLPEESYDLWERLYGIHTFTAGTVYGALKAAAFFAKKLGKHEQHDLWSGTANRIKTGILTHLYSDEDGFIKRIYKEGREWKKDHDTDMSSFYGIYKFGVLPIDDAKLAKMHDIVLERISVNTEIGGICRHEEDDYFRITHETTGNPWFITTLWLAQYYIDKARTVKELEKPYEWIKWAVKHSLPSGVMSEQLNPFNAAPVSATPLAWSHAEYIRTVVEYLDKLKELGGCEV